ncbi:MAG: hypothetical protein QME94_06250, partial [Anaerolineae bacterium]|nr:hypothetical protein [Anaerolineae bacterium]
MVRRAGAVLLGFLLLAALLGCKRASTPGPRPSPTGPATAAATPGTPRPLPTPDPAGRLPHLLAEISLELPGGQVYLPLGLACTEAGQSVVVGIGRPQLGVQVPRLMLLDPVSGARGPTYDLPGRSARAVATSGGRAFVAYEDDEYRLRLLAIDLETGRILADVPTDRLASDASLAAGPQGPLYCQTGERIEVRDPATLQVIRSVRYIGGPGIRSLALDSARGRLFVATGDHLLALRAEDLSRLWEVRLPTGQIARAVVVDRSGRQVLAQWDRYAEGQITAGLVAVAAESGQLLEPPQAPEGTGWELVAADCGPGYLFFTLPQQETRLWQARLDGRPTGVQTTLAGYARLFTDPQGRLLALLSDSHQLLAVDPATLEVTARGATGIEIRHLVTDPASERAYANDSAGRLHVIDTHSYSVLASLLTSTSPAGCAAQGGTGAADADEPIGSGPLTLDAANGLLFVGRTPWSHEVAVVRIHPLSVAGVITGGNSVAVDSDGHRAFVGWREPGPSDTPGEVQVWDTRTFCRLGAIAQRGAPTYNPLRNEVYVCDYSAHIVDGKTLQVTGELTPDIGGQAQKWCSGCLRAERITVDPAQDLAVVELTVISSGGGPGALPEPRTFSARSLQPVTHTATILRLPDTDGPPIICPGTDAIVYRALRFARHVVATSAVAYQVGSAEPFSYREGLSLDLYLPGRSVALSFRLPYILAYDPRPGHWEPLGWMPYQPIHAVDLAGQRLYAWEGGRLTVLGFGGSHPQPVGSPQPWRASERPEPVEEIHPSPAFARDRTLFAVAAGHILRSTDGGASWVELGGLPSMAGWSIPSYHLAISPDFERDRTLFVGGHAGEQMGFGVWRSQDAGETWQPAWHGLEHLRVEKLAISPRFAEDQTLLAYCSYDLFWRDERGQSLFRSENAGVAWVLAGWADEESGETLPQPDQLLLGQPSAVQFRLDGYEVLVRSADGAGWQPVLWLVQPGRLQIARSPAFERDGQVYALDPYTLYRSRDGGLSWQMATDPQAKSSDPARELTALAVALDDDGQPLIFLGDGRGSILALDPDELSWAPAPRPEPTPAPPASPTPCAAGVPRLGPWQEEQLGCPEAAPREVPMAWQPFERGQMFRQGERREIYILYSDPEANRWLAFADTWQEGQPERDDTLQPPPDRQQPLRGLGRVWREKLGGPAGNVGWAVGAEQSYSGLWQEFGSGRVLSAPDGALYALLADGTWVSG